MSFESRTGHQFSCYLTYNINNILRFYPKDAEPEKVYRAIVETVATYINKHHTSGFIGLDKIYANLIDESLRKLSIPVRIAFCSTPEVNDCGERIDRFVEGFFEPISLKPGPYNSF